MGVRRRRPELGAWIAFLLLAAAAWTWRADFLSALREDGTQASRATGATPDARVAAEAEADGADGADGDGTTSGTDPEIDAGTGTTSGTGAADEVDAEVGVARAPDAGSDAPAGDVGDAEPASDGDDAAPALHVVHERAASGLRRDTVRHDGLPVAGGPVASDADAAVAAHERRPSDPSVLANAVQALVAGGRLDEALEHVVRFAEDGGAPGVARELLDGLDPAPLAAVEALRAGLGPLVDAAELARDKQQWLLALAACDAAERLLDGIRAERPGPLAREDDRLADLLSRAREPLLRAPAALAEFARRDVPLEGEAADGRTGLERDRDDAADARARAEGRPVEIASTHYLVRTTLGTRVARDASALLEATYASCHERFGADPLRTGGRVIVEILEHESAFATRRVEREPPLPAWRDGFSDVPARTIVVLDPEAVGDPRELLWGRLAREASRAFVETWGPDALPPWLDEGLPATFEGAALRRDGSVVLDRPADARRRAVELSAAGRGAMPRRVIELLALEVVDADDVPWCWALVTYLREALATDGTPLWRDRFDDLLAAYHAGGTSLAPAEFRLRILRADGDPRDDVTTLEAFDERFRAWLARQDALDRGEPAALHDVLTLTQRAIDLRRFEEAESIVRRARRADPAQPLALWQAYSIARRRGETGESLLLALALAATRQPSGRWTPASGQEVASDEQRATSEELRYAELLELNASLGHALAGADLALRTAVERAVDARLAAGLPRAAVRLLDRVLAAWPLDAGYRAMRAAIVGERLRDGDLVVRRPIGALADVSEPHGDVDFWSDESGALAARCVDRVAPALLRGLAALRAPFTVAATLRFGTTDGRPATSLAGERAGFVLGGEDASLDGPWGVFATPAGRIELAHRGREEWPSRPIGRGARAPRLEVHVDGAHLHVRVDGQPLQDEPLGNRPADGWLGLFVRHVDVTFEDLVVTRTRDTDPAQRWYTRAAP